MTQTHAAKSWAGVNFNRQMGRERGLTQKTASWSPEDDDAQMFNNLVARAWREDPRPLSAYPSYHKE